MRCGSGCPNPARSGRQSKNTNHSAPQGSYRSCTVVHVWYDECSQGSSTKTPPATFVPRIPRPGVSRPRIRQPQPVRRGEVFQQHRVVRPAPRRRFGAGREHSSRATSPGGHPCRHRAVRWAQGAGWSGALETKRLQALCGAGNRVGSPNNKAEALPAADV